MMGGKTHILLLKHIKVTLNDNFALTKLKQTRSLKYLSTFIYLFVCFVMCMFELKMIV